MRPRRPDQLHAGRHGLTPDSVVAHQRARMLAAVREEVAARGYPATTVQDIIERAGVSRRTFYDQFAGKQAIYLEALEAFEAELREVVGDALGGLTRLDERVASGLGAILRFLAARPTSSRAFLVEVGAAGPRARARHDAGFAELVTALDEAADGDTEHRGAAGPGPIAASLVVGGVYQIVIGRMLAGESEDLPALAPDLADAVRAIYLGPDGRRRATARGERPPSTSR